MYEFDANNNKLILTKTNIARKLKTTARFVQFCEDEGFLSIIRHRTGKRRKYSEDDLDIVKTVLYLMNELSLNLTTIRLLICINKIINLKPNKYLETIQFSVNYFGILKNSK